MAKVKMADGVVAIHGKVSKRDPYYFSTNDRTGEVQLKTDGNKKGKKLTPAQKENTDRIGNISHLAKVWYDANKPNKENPEGTEAFRKVMEAYERQHRIGNPFFFVRSITQKDGSVLITE